MQLSRFSDYALRVLFFTAIHNDRLSNLGEVSHFYGISLDHLRKVVHALGKLGYLQTFRGKKGGFRLAINPHEVNIGELLRHTEGTDPLVDCEAPPCRLSGHCRLQGVLAEAQQAFFDVLSRYRLSDLIQDTDMQRLIQLKPCD